jgi:hypothetical protein
MLPARTLLVALAPLGAELAIANFVTALDAYNNNVDGTAAWDVASGLVYGMLALGALVVFFETLVVWQTYRSAQTKAIANATASAAKINNDNDDDDDDGTTADAIAKPALVALKDWTYIRTFDRVIDLVFLALALLTFVLAERHLDGVDWRSWAIVLLPAYMAFVLYVLILVAGALRTCGERRIESSDNCCVGAFGDFLVPCRARNHALETTANDVRVERNTMSQPALEHTYAQRAEYQQDPRVYVCVPFVIPSRAYLDRIEALFGWLRLWLFLAALILLTVRLEQGDLVDQVTVAAATTVSAGKTTAGEPFGVFDGVRMFVSPLQDASKLNGHIVDINHRLINSLAQWRSAHVLPMAVVLVPLFVWQGLFLILSLPVGVAMVRKRSNLRQWLSYIVSHVVILLLLIFEIIFAVHVDDSLFEQRSWHVTFVPLYAALTVLTLWRMIDTILCPSPKAKPSVVSRWGLVVFTGK